VSTGLTLAKNFPVPSGEFFITQFKRPTIPHWKLCPRWPSTFYVVVIFARVFDQIARNPGDGLFYGSWEDDGLGGSSGAAAAERQRKIDRRGSDVHN